MMSIIRLCLKQTKTAQTNIPGKATQTQAAHRNKETGTGTGTETGTGPGTRT